jgi:NADPH:quinone reductase-like Zn-dependent oxidoreductase
VTKPSNLTFEQAAAIPLAAVTALHGLRDEGHLVAGQKVLINGASGGVGTFAVQIAKALGAEVTGVCSTKNVDLVLSLGADHVCDYTREDFTRSEERYDLILDAAAYGSITDRVHALKPNGTYVLVGGATSKLLPAALMGAGMSVLGKKRVRVMLSKPDVNALAFIKELVEAGKIVPVTEKRFALRDVPDAIRYLELGHARGKVVITL